MANLLPIGVNSQTTGLLGDQSQNEAYDPTGGYLYDYYQLINFTPGVAVTVEMNSNTMNTWVGILNLDSGQWVTYDDDSGANTNSLLSFTPTLGDNYVIAASSSGINSTGSYALGVYQG